MPQEANILAIAPYQGLKNSLLEAAKALHSVKLDVIVANLEAAEHLLQPDVLHKYDILISRGGTAELISRMTRIPVVQIRISILDMLRIIQTARQSGDAFAIVGFGNVTRPALTVAEILHFDFPIVEISGKQEVEAVLKELVARGRNLIVGDVVTVNTARAMGLNALLVNSGVESASEALHDALSIFNSLSALRQEASSYLSMLDASDQAILYVDSSGAVRYQNPAFQSSGLSSDQLLAACAGQEGETLYQHDKQIYTILKKNLPKGEAADHVLFLERMPQTDHATHFSVQPLTAVEKAYCLYDRDTAKAVETMIGLSDANRVLCVYGDPGTERELLAKHLHCRLMADREGDCFFITVKSDAFGEESWPQCASLLHDYAQKKQVTLYFHDVQMIGLEGAHRLSTFLKQIGEDHRCLLIFSSTKSPDSLAVKQDYPDALCRQMCGPSCYIPPLCKRADSIPAICSMMVGKCNSKYGKQVVGFEPDAMRFLVEYAWPLNEAQLQNVITRAITRASKAYLTREELMPILRQPQSADQRELLVDTSLCLEQIEQEIIEHVLRRCGMNQTAAAQSLGLSRSTLWRKQKPE